MTSEKIPGPVIILEGKRMLVLSQKIGEGVMIGGGVAVTVLEIDGNKVRLGFKAPPQTPIHREENWIRFQGKDHDSTERPTS